VYVGKDVSCLCLMCHFVLKTDPICIVVPTEAGMVASRYFGAHVILRVCICITAPFCVISSTLACCYVSNLTKPVLAPGRLI